MSPPLAAVVVVLSPPLAAVVVVLSSPLAAVVVVTVESAAVVVVEGSFFVTFEVPSVSRPETVNTTLTS